MISSVESRWSFIAGALTFLLGAIVLIGWHAQAPSLVTLYPTFNILKYNAALGFFLLGLGLAAANFSYRGLSKILGAFVGLMAFLTLSEDVFSVDLGIDELVVSDYLRSNPTNPGRDLKLDVKPLLPAYADRATMCMVLVNLLSNAIKFTRPKGTAVVEVGGWTEGAENVYYVKDNGAGFDMRYVGKLFGVFQRLHATEEF